MIEDMDTKFGRIIPESSLSMLNITQNDVQGDLTLTKYLGFLLEHGHESKITEVLIRTLPDIGNTAPLAPLDACIMDGSTLQKTYRNLRYHTQLQPFGDIKAVRLGFHHYRIVLNPTSPVYSFVFTFDERGIHADLEPIHHLLPESVFELFSADPVLRKRSRVSHKELQVYALKNNLLRLYLYLEFVNSKESILMENAKSIMPKQYKRKLHHKLPKSTIWSDEVRT